MVQSLLSQYELMDQRVDGELVLIHLESYMKSTL